ncbi:MAG: HEPN domain-containing protein [Chitinispirillaceae bacterium]|nr:HEPN domain-containing protein [Chitinispirillaceae bacterium]
MKSKLLITDYLKRAKLRFKILPQFLSENDYADVIRISQEIVELIEKAIVIKIGINPPKWHDVIDIIIENKDRIPKQTANAIAKLRSKAKWLRSQREIAFYGDDDFIPLREYSVKDAKSAMETAKRFIEIGDKICNVEDVK